MSSGQEQVIQKLSYTHDAMIDLIVENPAISQGEIARHFGFTQGWVSQVIHADNFQEMLAARKADLIDPALKAKLDERMSALAHRSVDILLADLDARGNPDVALKVLDLTTRAKNYGAGVNVNVNNFVVAMPQKAESADQWIEMHKPQPVFRAGALPGANPLPMLTVDSVIDG